jgi:hypothetical protein
MMETTIDRDIGDEICVKRETTEVKITYAQGVNNTHA